MARTFKIREKMADTEKRLSKFHLRRRDRVLLWIAREILRIDWFTLSYIGQYADQRYELEVYDVALADNESGKVIYWEDELG